MTALFWALVAGPLLGLLTDAIETWWESCTAKQAHGRSANPSG